MPITRNFEIKTTTNIIKILISTMALIGGIFDNDTA